MSTLTITVNGSTLPVLEGSIKAGYTIDGRSALSFDVRDDTGTLQILPSQKVSLIDTVTGVTYNGYVSDCQIYNYVPNATNKLTVTVSDNYYEIDKRQYVGQEYINRYGGDIFIDQINTTLAAEGIKANYAIRNDQTQSQWNIGTLSGVVGTNNANGGDLELTQAGTAITIADDLTSGTFNGTVASGSKLIQSIFSAIKMVAIQSINNAGNTYTYVCIWSGSYAVPATFSGYFTYEIYVLTSSPEIKIGLDFICSDGTTLRDNGTEANAGFDLQDLSGHPATDLSGLADGKWYTRYFNLNFVASKTINYITIACEGDKTGTYTGYITNIGFTNTSFVTTTNVFNGANTNIPIVEQFQNYGYSSQSVTLVKIASTAGYKISNSYSISAAKIVGSTYLSWVSDDTATAVSPIPPSTGYTDLNFYNNGSQTSVAYSIDGGNSYITCTNNAPLPDFPTGTGIAGLSIMFKQTLFCDPMNPEKYPTLSSMNLLISPAYNGSKSDVIKSYATNSTWTTGTTLTNTTTNGGSTLALNGAFNNFDASSFSNLTLYGGTGAQIFIKYKTLLSGVNNGFDVRARMDFASTYANFAAEIDLLVSGSYATGMTYRTTNWGNSAASYAYSVRMTVNNFYFYRGNNSSGAGSETQLVNISTLTLVAGSWHRLKIVANGSTHTAYLDGVLQFTQTDATYSAGGYLAAHMVNGSGVKQQTLYDNFGVAPVSLSGTWLSPSISLNALGTYAASDLYYDNLSTDLTNCTVLAEYTINGGSTWTTIVDQGTNSQTFNATLPGLTIGQSLSGVSIQLRLTLSTTTASSQPAVSSMNFKVIGVYSSSGNRQSNPLSLSTVGRVGSTLVSWNGIQPTNTTILIDSSLDDFTWTNIGSGAIGSAQIAGITVQPDPVLDNFTVNDSASYTSTFGSGGSVAAWSWDTTNSRLVAVGGTLAQLRYSAATPPKDIDLIVIMDFADSGGMFWRRQDASNYYYCKICDSVSSTPNLLSVYRVNTGTTTQIGSSVAISFARNKPHVFRANIQGTAIMIYMDGILVQNLTDSSIAAAGQCGLYNNGGTSRYYVLRYQGYGDIVTSLQVFTRVRFTSTVPTVTPMLYDLSVAVRDPNIQSGSLIPSTKYSVLNGSTMTCAGIYDDVTKQSPGYWWRVDSSNNAYFQNRSAQLANWCITGADVIGVPKVDNAQDNYRNQQWITGAIDSVLITETLKGDNTRTSFQVGYPVNSIVSMSVNGVSKMFGVKSVDTGKDFYYQVGSNAIPQDTAGTILLSSQALTVSYYGQVPVTIMVKRDAAIAALALIDGTSGIIEATESVPGLTKQAAIILADGRLTQYCQSGRTIEFVTTRSGLQVGQLVAIFLPQYSIASGLFIITSIDIVWHSVSINGTPLLQAWYTVKATEGPITGDWTRFLSNIAKGGFN